MTDTPKALDTTDVTDRKVWPAVKNGLKSKCPNCGDGKLFKAYLKPVDTCSSCGENWEAVRADDGPAWLTILVVGHIVGPIFMAAVLNEALPKWIALGLFPIVTIAMCLAVLPLSKGAFMAIIWATGAPTSQTEITPQLSADEPSL